MKFTRGLLARLCCILVVGCAGTFAPAAPEPKVEMTVQLPPFIIEQPRGPRWRYLQIPRFEILSRCNDLTTQQLALAFHRANALLGLVLPERFQVALDVPQTLLFYDQKLWPAAEQAAVAAMLREKALPGSTAPAAPPRVRLTPLNPGQLSEIQRSAAPAETAFFSNLMLADADAITTFALVAEAPIDPLATYLTPAYVANLLAHRAPALPEWFTTGFLQLYSRLDFREQSVAVRPVRWDYYRPATEGTGTEPDLIPLGAFFSDEQAQARDPARWRAQAELIVSWGLAPDASRRDGFWAWVDQATHGTVTEEQFQACFGFDYAEAARQLAQQAGATWIMRWTLSDEAARLPEAPLEDASSGQVARIKGEWERLEARYVRKNQPDLEEHYVDLVRRTLSKAYDRGDRDPRLLASLGLLEIETGNPAAARPYLEEAVRAGVVRPRAYFELARLRYDALVGRSTRNDGKFPAEQIAPVIEPLLAGLKQSPPLSAAYQLLAHVAPQSVEPPGPEVLATLEEGARLFPQQRGHLLELQVRQD